MPYITSSGQVLQQQPLTLKRVLYWPVDLFWGVALLLSAFFGSCFGVSRAGSKTSASGGAVVRRGGGFGGGGGGGGGGAPRPTSHIRGMGDVRAAAACAPGAGG